MTIAIKDVCCKNSVLNVYQPPNPPPNAQFVTPLFDGACQDLRTSPGMFPRDITPLIITKILSAVSTKKGNVAVSPSFREWSINTYKKKLLFF